MIIAFGGDDTIIAGDREDDVLGGSGNDTIDLGVAADTLTGVDGFSDDVNAECTFKENGTDTVTWYDDEPGESGIYDVIDFSEAIEFVDPSDDDLPLTTEEKVVQVNAALTYDPLTGELGDADGAAWFVLSEDGGAISPTPCTWRWTAISSSTMPLSRPGTQWQFALRMVRCA